jgi:D-alanyl-D-alanine carboxypeptidase
MNTNLSPAPGALTAIVAITWLAAAGAALADPPIPPDAAIDADRAFVGDVHLGLESGEAGEIFSRIPDSAAAPASSTKTWAMHLVTEAIDSGDLELDDIVTLSSNSLIPRCHGHSALTGAGVGGTPVPGDQYLLADLLYGTMIDSASEGPLGSAEWLAQTLSPGLTTGAQREAWFVQRMNNHADAIGLENTTFFNPYGGDHLHAGSCGGGAAVSHQTTARDMARWMAHAMDVDNVFRLIMSYRGNLTINSVDNSRTHVMGGWNWSYPGLLGRKGGSNGSCTSCSVAQAQRIGRDLVATFMQSVSNSGDENELLDYGFAKTFYPEHQAASVKWGPVKHQALAAVGSTRALSAVITDKDKIELITWAVDAQAGTIERIGNGMSGPCSPQDILRRSTTQGLRFGPSVVGTTRSHLGRGQFKASADDDRRDDDDDSTGGGRDDDSTDDDGRDDDGDRGDTVPGNGFGYGIGRGGVPVGGNPGGGGPAFDSPWKPESLDLAHVGSGFFVMAVETPQTIQMSSWGMPPCGQVFQRGSRLGGDGTDVKLQELGDGLFVLGALQDNGSLRMTTWQLDLNTGAILDGPLGTIGLIDIEDFDFSSQPVEDGGSMLVLAYESDDGIIGTSTLGVEADGSIGLADNTTAAPGSGVSIARVYRPGQLTSTQVLAFITTDGELSLRVLSVDDEGDIARVGQEQRGTVTVDQDGLTAIAGFRRDGVMVLTRDSETDQTTTMSVWSIDDDPNANSTTSSVDANFVVQEDTSLAVGRPNILRLPTGLAEGDFLIAQLDGFDFEEPLQLELFRSGPRQ